MKTHEQSSGVPKNIFVTKKADAPSPMSTWASKIKTLKQ